VTIPSARLSAALVGFLLVVVPLSGCAGKAPDSSAATATSGSAASTGSSTSSAASGQRIEVTVAHGKASGDTGRVEVATGTAVTLVVTSDVADEVHVHGYDIEKELTPGEPATLQFDATVPGVFEVELHHAGTVLLRLQVS
jgi:plastocyanin